MSWTQSHALKNMWCLGKFFWEFLVRCHHKYIHTPSYTYKHVKKKKTYFPNLKIFIYVNTSNCTCTFYIDCICLQKKNFDTFGNVATSEVPVDKPYIIIHVCVYLPAHWQSVNAVAPGPADLWPWWWSSVGGCGVWGGVNLLSSNPFLMISCQFVCLICSLCVVILQEHSSMMFNC